MNAVQMKGFPLAGLLTFVNLQNLAKLSHNLTKPDMRNLSKLDIVIGKITTNCDVENLSKPDIRPVVRLTAWLSKVVIESVGTLTIVDIKSAEMMANDGTPQLSRGEPAPIAQEFCESIKKGSTFGAAPGVDLSVGQSSAASDFGARRCSSVRATLTSCWISSPAFAPISSMRISASLAKRSADSAPPLNWRRAISPRIAVTMKLAVDSLSYLTASISSIASCGTRAARACDFAFFAPVAITELLKYWCATVYSESENIKDLTCSPPTYDYVYTLSTGKAQETPEITKPGSASTPSGPLTTTVKASNEVAMSDHITPISGRDSLTPKKYQYRFLALSRADAAARPCRVSIEAATEQEARRALAPLFILSLAARLPAQEAHHA